MRMIGLLRKAEVEKAQGRTVGEVRRGLGMAEASFYRRRAEYSGLWHRGVQGVPAGLHDQ
jgi:hypothetical protein